MTIDEALLAFIKAIGAVPADDVEQGVRRQGSAQPAIAITRIGGSDLRGMGGELIQQTSNFRIDVYADTYSVLSPVMNQVQGRLSGFRGWMDSVFVGLCTTTGPTDVSEDDGDQKIRHQILDVEIISSGGT